MSGAGALFGLFLASFLAATLLPAQSEALLFGMARSGGFDPIALLVVASAGNVLGSVVNWWIGRQADRFRHKRWFPVTEGQLERASRWYRRWGRWSLLLSWMPVVGDPLTLVAGVLREPLTSFLLIVALAKAGRYGVVLWAAGLV